MNELTVFEREVIDRLARIETKLEKVENHEERISTLEETVNQQKGKATMLTALIGFAGAFVGVFGGKLL